MRDEDRQRFSVVMFWLAEKFPLGNMPRRLSPKDVDDYYRALADIRIERLEWGAREWFAQEVFWPKPPELRRVANLAPSSVLPGYVEPKQIPDLTPPDVAVSRLREIFRGLNEKFGTRLAID